MERLTGILVALATLAAVMTGSTAVAGERRAAATENPGLPREIPGGVEVAMVDGDRLRVWAAANHRAVWAKRYDAATGSWSARREVLRKKNLSCGDVDARTANGAVAVTAECDPGSWSEDQAPVATHALWSADTLTWSSYQLEGEAHDEPGISSDGRRAVWPQHGGYVTLGPEGFTRHTLEATGQEYTTTATITDGGQVSFLYGSSLDGACGIVVLTRTGDAPPTRQEVALDDACQDRSFTNVDSDTTWFGEYGQVSQRTVISRPDASSPWSVTQVAPATAPGLERVEGRLGTTFVDTTGFPLMALGSPGGRRVRAQVYDASSQRWGASQVVHDTGGARCRWGDDWFAEPLAVVVVTLKCGSRNVVLTTADGLRWQALRMGRHALGLSFDGRYAVVPGRSRTTVISPELGAVTLPLGVRGACDVVVPDGPDGAVLLTAAGRNRGWPTVLRRSSPDGVDDALQDEPSDAGSGVPPGTVRALRPALPLHDHRAPRQGLSGPDRAARRWVDRAAQPLVNAGRPRPCGRGRLAVRELSPCGP